MPGDMCDECQGVGGYHTLACSHRVSEDVSMGVEERMDISALWGSAQNGAYSVPSRLSYALAALEKMSKHIPGWDE